MRGFHFQASSRVATRSYSRGPLLKTNFFRTSATTVMASALLLTPIVSGDEAPKIAPWPEAPGVVDGGLKNAIANLFGSTTSNSERLKSLEHDRFIVRSIDPTDEDFSDLEPLVEILRNRRFVLMTELTHRDGATFDAR